MDPQIKPHDQNFTPPQSHNSSFKMLIVILVIATIAAGMLLAAFFIYPPRESSDNEKVSIKVGLKWLHQAQFAGMYVAQAEGMYDDSELDVELIEFDFIKPPAEKLVDGEIDFALMSADELLTHINHGDDLTALAAIYQISPIAFVTLKDSNITDPLDFKDKVLGSKGGKIEEDLAYLSVLQTVGINESDVNIKVVGFEQTEAKDLESGEVDVIDLYRTDQLYYFEQTDTEYNVIYPEKFGSIQYNDVIVARTSYIERNPEITKKFIGATIDGWNKAVKEPTVAIEHTMNFVSDDNYRNINHQQFILKNSIPLIQPNAAYQIGSMNFIQWNALRNTMIHHNLIDDSFDVESVYTNLYIQ